MHDPTSPAQLTSADFQKLLAVLPTLYEAGDLTSLPRRMMLTVSPLVPCDSLAYEECNPFLGRAIGRLFPDDMQATATPASVVRFGELLPTHPLVKHWIRRGSLAKPGADNGDSPPMDDEPPAENAPVVNDGALKISDFISAADLENSALFTDIYRERNIKEQLSILIAFPKPLMVAVGCHRDRRTFTERDRLMLNLLHPHLLAAYRNAEAFTELRTAIGAHRRRVGTLKVNADGRVDSEEGHASALLKDYFHRDAKGPRFPAPLKRWFIQARKNPTTARVWTLRGKHGLLVLRMLNDQRENSLTILLEELQENRIPNGEHPALAILPPRLRQTLAALLAGKSTKEIAAQMGLSRHTASEHVSRLYARLSVSTRGELLALFVK